MALLQVVHIAAWALCYGAITFMYFRFTAQIKRFAQSDEEHNRLELAIEPGLWAWTALTTGLAALTGVALVVGRGPGANGWTPVVLKSSILLAMVGVLTYARQVAWRRRVAATPDRRPGERQHLFRVAFLFGFFLLCQLLLGIAAHVEMRHAIR